MHSIPIEDFRDHFLDLCWAIRHGTQANRNTVRSALWLIPGFKQEFYNFSYGGRRDA